MSFISEDVTDFQNTDLPNRFSESLLQSLGRVNYFQQIDSTNTYLLQRHKELPNLSVCLASEQLAGRGRRGKDWRSNRDSGLYCSVLFHHQGAVTDLPPLSIIAAIAVARTFANLLPSVPYGVKWPNDVLTANGKLCGILVESMLSEVNKSSWVIGIGVNLAQQFTAAEKSALPYPIADFRSEGYLPADKAFWPVAEVLLAQLHKLLSDLPSKQSLPELYRQIDLFDHCQVNLRDNTVAASDGHENAMLVGKAEGINEQGALLFRNAQQQRMEFYSGDVSIDVNSSEKRYVVGDVNNND